MTDRDPSYVIGLDELQCEELIPTFQWAFGVEDPARTRRWFERSRLRNLRGYRRDGRLVGGLVVAEMGQWFGGRAVPMAGLAGVAVAPEVRGGGLARSMMAACLRELYELGTPLSALYPATVPLYRAVGYEVGGYRYRVRVPTTELPRGDRALPMRELEPEDEEAVTAAYRACAARSPGWLDRGPYIWGRVRAPKEKPARGFAVEVDGVIEGYGYLVEHPTGGEDEYRLEAVDLVANTERAGLRLLSFLADHRSIPDRLDWYGDPAGPLVGLLPERRYEVEALDPWMLRLVDVPAALAARGYAPTVGGELHLRVVDELLPDNDGPWHLTVDGGRATVERGGKGELAISVRGLAALYAGFRSAEVLEAMGQLDGPEPVLAAASGLFAGPAPSMVDDF